jgi:hypothetical protein
MPLLRRQLLHEGFVTVFAVLPNLPSPHPRCSVFARSARSQHIMLAHCGRHSHHCIKRHKSECVRLWVRWLRCSRNQLGTLFEHFAVSKAQQPGIRAPQLLTLLRVILEPRAVVEITINSAFISLLLGKLGGRREG